MNVVSEYELHEVVFAATLNLYVPGSKTSLFIGNPNSLTNGRMLSLLLNVSVSGKLLATTCERSSTYARSENKQINNEALVSSCCDLLTCIKKVMWWYHTLYTKKSCIYQFSLHMETLENISCNIFKQERQCFIGKPKHREES